MNDPAGRTRMLLSHNIQCILRRIPAVYIDRKLCLLCHFQLFDKPPFLNIMRFFIPIIIQTNFSVQRTVFDFCKALPASGASPHSDCPHNPDEFRPLHK